METRSGIFAGEDPFEIVRTWMAEAEAVEPNDPNAMALATSDDRGMPNVRMVLLKEVEDDAFVFFTNYESTKGQELTTNPQAAFVMHWKSLRRQVRVRGTVTVEDGPQADDYFASRSLKSRIGAWASKQSTPLASRESLMAKAAKEGVAHGLNPKRPHFWGGFRIKPVEIEFWADGDFRLHDRFQWYKEGANATWEVTRLHP